MGSGNVQVGKERDSALICIVGRRAESFRTGRFHAIHWRDEAVSATRESLDEARTGRGITQRFANLVNGGIQAVVEIDESVGGPDFLTQVIACNYAPGTFEQNAEDLKRLLLETHESAILAELSGRQVHLKDAKAPKPGFAAGRWHRHNRVP